VAKEVYGKVLAAALGLPTPEAVLVRFTPEFVATLNPDAKDRYEQSQRGLRFATRYREGYTWHYNHEKHLFYPYLKKSKLDSKQKMFAPFMESLERLDPFILEESGSFLTENGQLCADLETITEYLCAVQAHPDIFLHILLRQLS